MMKRRTFLQTGAAACLTGCGGKPRSITGSIIGANQAAGHWLRDLKAPPQPSRTLSKDVVIAGAGMSGLIAAWRLQRAGVQKITLLDLEAEAGGNARSGSNAISAYPWGAHYVPAPGPDAAEVRQVFEELGLITGHDAAGRPRYDEANLCADPQERLFMRGVWQEGLAPNVGLKPEERAELERFTTYIAGLRQTKGNDGKRLFTIPLDQSSRDPDWLALDVITMEEWMTRQGYRGIPLRWYVNYCCRDDYGAGITQVSAWAGLHYFASRDDPEFLTWPAGNGWLVQQLMKGLKSVDFQKAVVFRMESSRDVVQTDAFIPETGECVRWNAKAAVCAMPRFVAQRIIAGMELMKDLPYSPWAVANLTWHGPTTSTWDSVFYEVASLGYVSATHQTLRQSQSDTVLTWYQPLDHLAPAQARQEAQSKPWSAWRDVILEDMKRGHPDVAEHVSQIDVMLWGHGMIRPVPGFVWSAAREQMVQPQGRIAFAHTDMSGISLFEEACARGAAAASQVRHWLDHA